MSSKGRGEKSSKKVHRPEKDLRYRKRSRKVEEVTALAKMNISDTVWDMLVRSLNHYGELDHLFKFFFSSFSFFSLSFFSSFFVL